MTLTLKSKAVAMTVGALGLLGSPLLTGTAFAASAWTFSSGSVPLCADHPDGNSRLNVSVENRSTETQTVSVSYRADDTGELLDIDNITVAAGRVGQSSMALDLPEPYRASIELASPTDQLAPTVYTCDKYFYKEDGLGRAGHTPVIVGPNSWRVFGSQGGIDNRVQATHTVALTTFSSLSAARTEINKVKTDVAGVKADTGVIRSRVGNRTKQSCTGGRAGRADGGTAQLFVDLWSETTQTVTVTYRTNKGMAYKAIALTANVPTTVDVNRFMTTSEAGPLNGQTDLLVTPVVTSAQAVSVTCRQFYGEMTQGVAGAMNAAIVLPTVSN